MQYTTNYNLKEPQYADEADIEKINENTEAIDNLIHQNRTMIAPAFDNTKAYVTGDPVEYLGALYVFTADKAAGAWDASKVAPTTAAEMGGGGASAIADLDDVDITSPTDGQALVYDDSDDTWKNATLPEPVDVVANPSASATVELEKLKVGSTVYSIEGESVTKTATGNSIELTDAASAPLVKCVTQITGYQEGTGTPSPDNIRPIVAYTEGEIEVRGRNLWDSSLCTFAYMTLDGTIYKNTNTDTASQFDPYISVYNVTTLLFNSRSFTKTDNVYSMAINIGYDFTKIVVRHNGSSRDLTISFPYSTKGKYVISFKVLSSNIQTVGGLQITDIQLERGEGLHDYEPYTSTTHTTTYPSAIYRGSEDCVKGEVVTEWGMIASYAGETLQGEWISDRDEYAPGTTPTTGAQVAYELATPTTSSVTPTNLPIRTLSGYNHIESSTGEMEIEYITKTYEPLVDLIEASDHIYSTQEQAVGTWIDGKTLYEKTIKKQNISSASTSTVLIPSSELTGMDIVEISGSYISTTTASTYPINAYINSNSMIATWFAEGDIYYWLYWGAADTYDVYITIRYTKSTQTRSLSAPVTSQKSISEPLTDKTEEVPTEEEKTVEKPETEEENNEAER